MEPLTKRQAEIAALLAKGMSNKEIAVLLKIKVKTADVHRTNIYSKLGIHRREHLHAALAALANLSELA